MLVVEGPPESLAELSRMPGFLLIGTPPHPGERPRKILTAVATLTGVVVVASLGIVPVVTAATAGCAVLMLTGCLRPREAYQAIDWSIIFVLAGALALGTSLQKTGITADLAFAIAGLGGAGEPVGPMIVLALFFVVAVVVSELISNSGTVLILGPVAFAMPIGYQTSLMIYGPGGYRFRDYLKMGIPLDVLMGLLALWLIPVYWPLTPP